MDRLCFQQGKLLSASLLEALTCGQTGSSQLRKLLLVPEQQQPLLQAYADAMCGGTGGQRSERFRRMSVELMEQINRQTAAEKVSELTPPAGPSAAPGTFTGQAGSLHVRQP